LHRADLLVREEGNQGRADDRLAGNAPILLGYLAAGAISPPGCDNHSRNPTRHEKDSARDFGIALAHVPQMCERNSASGPHFGSRGSVGGNW
jgi:hypothetical protein